MSPISARPASLRAYNPDWLSDDDLLSGFIARKPLFEFLRDELRRVPRSGTVQARLLIGVRGAGKTTLLKRLAVAIRREAELADHLIALSFPEELYQVKGLADLWWAACEALADELMTVGQSGTARTLLRHVDERPLPRAGDDPHDDRGLRLLLRTCRELGRRPVLLLDNFDLLLDRIDKDGRKTVNPQSRAYWVLREVLSNPDSPVLIGGSARLSEPLVGYDKAFFDFFIPHRLGKLSLEEVLEVFDHLARQHGDEALRARLRQRRGRVSALYEMTGGNPRALMLIFDLLRQGPGSRAVDDFERLLDLTTPYYKARFEDLPEQAQVVMHALAMIRRESLKQARFGHTAATIARRAGLETRIVSAQLDVLIRAGVVEKDDASKGRVQYRIAEQLFRLWLQMRSSRRIRHQVVGLTEYLEALFDRSELARIHHESLGNCGSDLARARIAYAVSELQIDEPDRHYFQSYAVEAASDGSGANLPQLFEADDLPADLQQLADCRLKLKACEARLHALRADAPELMLTLLGSLRLSLADKCSAVERLVDTASTLEELSRLSPLLKSERRQLLRDGLTNDDLALLYRERAAGRLQLTALSPQSNELGASAVIRALVWKLLSARIPLPTEDVALAWIRWGQKHFGTANSHSWAGIARACRRAGHWGDSFQTALGIAFEGEASAHAWVERGLYLKVQQKDKFEAEVAHRRAIEIDPTDAWPWVGLGNLLAEDPVRRTEAEAAYRRAIEINPAHAGPWNNLGILLAQDIHRHAEAEAAYRRAIEIDPFHAGPWNNLGVLLAENPQRFAEAEAACRHSIEFDSADARSWNNLGTILGKSPKRFAEAEAAYRRALDLGFTDMCIWINLGNLLARDPSRFVEAEAAYRRAISLNPDYAWSWNNLGVLLAGDPQRNMEAEAAYRRAIELGLSDVRPWINLGNLLARNHNRLPEAEAAYRRAIDLDPTNAHHWNDLGLLLAQDNQRLRDAEAAYRRAINLDPDYAWPWNNLGFLLAGDPQRNAEAEAAYQRAIELGLSDGRLWINLGNLLARDPSRVSEAETAYRRAIEIDPANPWPWNNLGFLFATVSKRPIEAEAAYRRAIEIDPALANAWNNLGILLSENPERQSEAEETFMKCLALNPDSLFAKWQLGKLHTQQALNVARTAISIADWSATRQALQSLSACSTLFPGWASDISFLTGVIAPILRAGQGRWLLDTLRELGYETIAAPLLLAIEARLDGDAKALEGIEPELRRASQQVHAELEAALDPSVVPG